MLHAHLVAKTRPAALKENIICFNDTRVTVLSPRLFRIEKEPEGRFLDEATQAVWFRDMPPTPCGFRKEDGRYVIETEAARLTVCDPLSDSFVTFPDGKTAAADDTGNLKGTYRTLDRCDGDEYLPSSPGEPNRPIRLKGGVVSLSGAAVYDDSASLILGQDG